MFSDLSFARVSFICEQNKFVYVTTIDFDQMDTKREEFRKYLEKEGVLEYLTKSLVSLIEVNFFSKIW